MTPEEKMRACKTTGELDDPCKELWYAVRPHFGGQPAGFVALILATMMQCDENVGRAFAIAMLEGREQVYKDMLRGIEKTAGVDAMVDAAFAQARTDVDAELKQKVGG